MTTAAANGSATLSLKVFTWPIATVEPQNPSLFTMPELHLAPYGQSIQFTDPDFSEIRRFISAFDLLRL